MHQNRLYLHNELGMIPYCIEAAGFCVSIWQQHQPTTSSNRLIGVVNAYSCHSEDGRAEPLGICSADGIAMWHGPASPQGISSHSLAVASASETYIGC